MIKNIRHTGIVVSDLEASLYFYKELLGFQVMKQMDESGDYIDKILSLNGTKVRTIKMVSPDKQMIELLYYYSHKKEQKLRDVNDIGISHIAFTVDDVDREYNRLREHGVLFNTPACISPDGYAKVAFCRAPEGTLIELVEVRNAK